MSLCRKKYRLSLVGLLNDEPLLPSGLAMRGRGRKGLEFPRLLILPFLAQERLAACFGDARLLPHDAQEFSITDHILKSAVV